MVEPSEHRDSRDRAGERGPYGLEGKGSPLVDPLVRPRHVEVPHVFDEDVPKMVLGQHDSVIDSLAADASQEPLAHCVHER